MSKKKKDIVLDLKEQLICKQGLMKWSLQKRDEYYTAKIAEIEATRKRVELTVLLDFSESKKLTVVLDYYEAMKTYSRILLLRN
jgi:hypothetical protein